MLKEGTVVRLNNKVPNDSLHNFIAIITNILEQPNTYTYKARFVSPDSFGEHRSGNIKATWVDAI